MSRTSWKKWLLVCTLVILFLGACLEYDDEEDPARMGNDVVQEDEQSGPEACDPVFNEHGLEVNCSMQGFNFTEEEYEAIVAGPTGDQNEDKSTALSCPEGNYGDPIGFFLGKTAYSNGANDCCTTTWCGQWQCVEFVNRFYDHTEWRGNGNDYFRLGPDRGFEQRVNGQSTIPPVPGDMLGWRNSNDPEGNDCCGHVGVVKDVVMTSGTTGQVYVIEQNYHNQLDYYRVLYMSKDGNGRWSIANGSDRLALQGWLHMPGMGGGTYAMDWVYQTPDGTQVRHVGERVSQIVMAFQNIGTATWYKNDTFLVSVNSAGEMVDSRLFDAPTWINAKKVVKMDQDTIGPGATARFTFTIQLPSTANPNIVKYYFRLYNNNVGLIEAWPPQQNDLPIVTLPNTSYDFKMQNNPLWEPWVKNGATTGKTNSVAEAMRHTVDGGGSDCYRVRRSGDGGWTGWGCNGAAVGSISKGQCLEGIAIEGSNSYLAKYDILYKNGSSTKWVRGCNGSYVFPGRGWCAQQIRISAYSDDPAVPGSGCTSAY